MMWNHAEPRMNGHKWTQEGWVDVYREEDIQRLLITYQREGNYKRAAKLEGFTQRAALHYIRERL